MFQTQLLSMMSNTKLFGSRLILLTLLGSLFVSCGGGEDTDDIVETTDTVKASVLNVAGELFSVPSPIQTALLIQKSGVPYNKDMLNASNKVNIYSTDFLRTLNLGIYGADLGYVSLYNQSQDALGYLAALKQLSDKLGISAAFDGPTMERIKNNITNKDSMMTLVAIAYRGSDAYLKNNQRSDVSALILAGGWIESMYFSTVTYGSKPSNEIKYRITEQKQALNSLVKILGMNQSAEVKELTAQMTELQKVYEGIEFKYTFVEPTLDTIKKITYINSKTEVIVSDDQMKQIVSMVEVMRNKIVSTSKS